MKKNLVRAVVLRVTQDAWHLARSVVWDVVCNSKDSNGIVSLRRRLRRAFGSIFLRLKEPPSHLAQAEPYVINFPFLGTTLQKLATFFSSSKLMGVLVMQTPFGQSSAFLS